MSPRNLSENFKPVDIIVVDCSFISLRSLLPNLVHFVKPQGLILPLIKPQFEAGKAIVDKGKGVIRDPQVHLKVIHDLRDFVLSLELLDWKDVVESPILGPSGNKEFLAHLVKRESAG